MSTTRFGWRPPAKKPPLLTSRRAWLAGAGILGTACLLRGRQLAGVVAAAAAGGDCLAAGAACADGSRTRQPGPLPRHPALEIRTATEQEILRNVATGLTVFRFAADQRILVLDFASLHQQGMMLNRVAALIEKAGQPRNRVLTAAELAAGDPCRRRHAGNLLLRPRLQRRVAAAFLHAGGRGAICRSTRKRRRCASCSIRSDWFKPDVHGGLDFDPGGRCRRQRDAVGARHHPASRAVARHVLRRPGLCRVRASASGNAR